MGEAEGGGRGAEEACGFGLAEAEGGLSQAGGMSGRRGVVEASAPLGLQAIQ